MSRVKEFRLPDLGEGLTEGEILQWMVAVGDTIVLNQPIVEVETAKAAVEVPSPFAGVVATIHHEAGSIVDVGAVIISVDTDPGAGALELVPARTPNLVGYGPKQDAATRRPRTAAAPVPEPQPEPRPETAARVSAAAVGQAAAQSAGALAVRAKPPVRKLAKERGVDLSALLGTGPAGTITRADVEGSPVNRPPRSVATDRGDAQLGTVRAGLAEAATDRTDWDDTRERRIPVKGVRKMTAQAMVGSAFTAPHVTEFITFDMTPSMDLLLSLRRLPELADVKVTPLVLVAKALLLAVRRNPEINSTFTDDEIIVKDYVNLGIAAATPRGLLVPNIKDADRMSLVKLASALQDLVATARDGRTTPADMARGTITITNVGTFGIDTGTPIINPGESAILCFGAIRPTPWVVDGTVQVRQVTTLALSFDHRNVDGQLGSQFLADIARVLSDPAVALAWS
jgi:2-oxoisovalerate dehydrogenase E2 component (dihydrolipoyl transacylase)